MKIPYIKIPVADISAYLSGLDFETKGKIFQAVLDYGLYQKWAPLDLDEAGCRGYANVQEIVENETKSYKKFLKSQKEKAKKLWDKKQNHDEAVAMPDTKSTLCQTETKTETDTDINKLLSADQAAQPVETVDNSKPKPIPKPKRELTVIQQFSNRLLDNGFEPDIDRNDKARVGVWYRANCKYFSEILKYCHDNIDLAEACVYVCATKLEKAGLTGSYAAVVRNLPQYYAEAEKLKGVKNESS